MIPQIEIDSVIIGAGVVGLAIAQAISNNQHSVVVLDQEKYIGFHTSSRNSEVIHAGFYYPTNSNKAKMCVLGKEKLVQFLENNHLPYRITSKLLLSQNQKQNQKIEKLYQQGLANGVEGLTIIDENEIKKIEPAFIGIQGLLSKETGIIDSHAYMKALKKKSEEQGTIFVFENKVLEIERQNDGRFKLYIQDQKSSYCMICKYLINSAGLWAQQLANQIKGINPNFDFHTTYAKGSYASLSKRSPTNRLIYPLPEEGGLGIHLTIDMAGNARFGPNVQWIESIDYKTPDLIDDFYNAIRIYWPKVQKEYLQMSYSGIRTRTVAKGKENDFVMLGPKNHQIEGLILLLGIESPGLTSSLAIADWVKAQLY